jgi:hypothetical protein
VSEEEFLQLWAAQKSGRVARGVVPRGSAGEGERRGAESRCDSASTGHEAFLAELQALREILLNVLFRQANGKTLTAPEMQG